MFILSSEVHPRYTAQLAFDSNPKLVSWGTQIVPGFETWKDVLCGRCSLKKFVFPKLRLLNGKISSLNDVEV